MWAEPRVSGVWSFSLLSGDTKHNKNKKKIHNCFNISENKPGKPFRSSDPAEGPSLVWVSRRTQQHRGEDGWPQRCWNKAPPIRGCSRPSAQVTTGPLSPAAEEGGVMEISWPVGLSLSTKVAVLLPGNRLLCWSHLPVCMSFCWTCANRTDAESSQGNLYLSSGRELN